MHRYIPGACLLGPIAPKPPVHRPSSVRCQSRRWRLLTYYTGQGKDAWRGRPRRAHGCRRQYHRPLRVVSKCALTRGPIKEKRAPRLTRTLPLCFPCWSITALPSCASFYHKRTASRCSVSVVKPPFTQYISNKSSGPFIHALLNLTKQRGLCRVIMTRHSLTTSVNVNRWRRLLTPAGAG